MCTNIVNLLVVRKSIGEIYIVIISPFTIFTEIKPAIFLKLIGNIFIDANRIAICKIINIFFALFPRNISERAIIVINCESEIVLFTVHLDGKNSRLIRQGLVAHLTDPFTKIVIFYWRNGIFLLIISDRVVIF